MVTCNSWLRCCKRVFVEPIHHPSHHQSHSTSSSISLGIMFSLLESRHDCLPRRENGTHESRCSRREPSPAPWLWSTPLNLSERAIEFKPRLLKAEGRRLKPFCGAARESHPCLATRFPHDEGAVAVRVGAVAASLQTFLHGPKIKKGNAQPCSYSTEVQYGDVGGAMRAMGLSLP